MSGQGQATRLAPELERVRAASTSRVHLRDSHELLEAVRAARDHHPSYTMQEIADAAGTTRQAISQLLKRRLPATDETAAAPAAQP